MEAKAVATKRADIQPKVAMGISTSWSNIVRRDGRMLDLTNKGITSLYKLPDPLIVQCALLAKNEISSFVQLKFSVFLKFLDLSENNIELLPVADFWEHLPNLRILFLHQNRINKISCFAGLAGLARLRVLTAHNNPASLHPAYSITLELLCHNKLLSLDGTVCDNLKNDQAVSSQLHFKLSEFVTKFPASVNQPDTTYRDSNLEDIKSSFNQYLSALHQLVRMRRPFLVIQSTYRGHVGRRAHRLKYADILPIILKIQRWLVRSWAGRRVVQMLTEVQAADERGECEIPKNIYLGASDSAESAKALYFLPGDFVRIAYLLYYCRERQIFDEQTTPRLVLSRICALRILHTRKASRNPFIPGLVARRARCHKLSTRISDLMRIKNWIPEAQRHSFTEILKRGYKFSRADISRYGEIVQNSIGSDLKPGECNRIVIMQFKSQKTRRAMIRIIAGVNASSGIDRQICYAYDDLIQLLVAATTVQTAGRAWYQRNKMKPPLGAAVLILRSTILIQRWWKWTILRRRIDCLALLKQRLRRTRGCSLYLFASHVAKHLHKISPPCPSIPETYLGFGIDPNGSVFVFPSTEYDLDRKKRSPIPEWLNISIPVNIGFAQSRLEDLIRVNCVVDSFSMQGPDTFFPGQGPKSAPRRFLHGTILVLKIMFPSISECKRRLALLFLHTWRPRLRDPLLLLSSKEVESHLFATLVQACFRGFLSRRWLRNRQMFLAGRVSDPRKLTIRPQHFEGIGHANPADPTDTKLTTAERSPAQPQEGCFVVAAIHPSPTSVTDFPHNLRTAAVSAAEKTLALNVITSRRKNELQQQQQFQKIRQHEASLRRTADLRMHPLELRALLRFNRQFLKTEGSERQERHLVRSRTAPARCLSPLPKTPVIDESQIPSRAKAEEIQSLSMFGTFNSSAHEAIWKPEKGRMESFQFGHDFMCKSTFAADRTDYIYQRRSEHSVILQQHMQKEIRIAERELERKYRQRAAYERLDAMRKDVREVKNVYLTKLEMLRSRSNLECHRNERRQRMKTDADRPQCKSTSPILKSKILPEQDFGDPGFLFRSLSTLTPQLVLPGSKDPRGWTEESARYHYADSTLARHRSQKGSSLHQTSTGRLQASKR